MGEGQEQEFQLSSNRFLRAAFQRSRVTPDGGLILVRELDERLGFGELIEQHLTDSRANNARFSFANLLRQSVYSRLAGYEDVNDAERLSRDPTFRLIGSDGTVWENELCSEGSTGGKRVYTRKRWRVKKLIPEWTWLKEQTLDPLSALGSGTV
jgi:hypothetical protein